MSSQTQFLVVGPQRSGTTIFSEILQRHDDICLTIDAKLLYYELVWLVNDFPARGGMHPRLDEICHALSRKTVRGDAYSRTDDLIKAVRNFAWEPTTDINAFRAQVAALWTESYRAVSSGALAVGDKYNEYMLYADDINRCFPDMKYIVLNRNPAQSAQSALHKFQGRQWQPETQQVAEGKIAAWYRFFNASRIKPENILQIQFEDFCHDPDGGLAEACDFLGLPVCQTMLEFSDSVLDPARASRWPVQTPIAVH